MYDFLCVYKLNRDASLVTGLSDTPFKNRARFDMVAINSSVNPSAKYSSLGSGLMFENGRTAILRLSSLNGGSLRLLAWTDRSSEPALEPNWIRQRASDRERLHSR